MHPADIQAALKKLGYTQKQIAEELGIEPINISRVIHHIANSERVRRAVADAIGIDRTIVFEEYYRKPNRRKKFAWYFGLLISLKVS